MGFTVRSPIPSYFNDVESWKEAVTPCCHCTAFRADRPLKKKLLKFATHHDVRLAEPYRCQSLWSVLTGENPLQNSKRPTTLNTVLDVGLSSENPITSNKRKKVAPSDVSANEERVPPYRLPTAPINQVATGVTQADIDKLETKLLASYEYRLSQYIQEIATLQVQLASEKAYSSARGQLELQNASLQKENRSLSAANTTLLAEVMEERRRIRKQVLALASSKARASSSTFVSNLEDCTMQHMSRGVNRKYLAEKLADVVREEAYGGLCGEYLSSTYCVEIQATNPYRNAMEVARVMDLGSGQLNISGFELLRKGIEGDENGRVKYGGGWLTTKYYLQQANTKVHSAAQLVIPFQEVPATDLDGFTFDFSKMLVFLLEMFQLDHIARDPSQPPVQLACTLDGADISKFVSHVTAGIKILDPRAIDPISHLPIGLEGSKKVQSRDLCFPFKMLLTRDTKTLYKEHFKDFFDFFSRLNLEGIPELGNNPISVSSPQDMSSMWKALGRGGGCKVKTFFCYCCAVTSKDSATPRKTCCHSCLEKGRQKCYHSDIGDESTLLRLTADLQQMTTTHQFLQFEDSSGLLLKLQSHLNPSQFEKEKDPSNIEFVPQSDIQKREYYLNYLKPDLSLLGLSIVGSPMERVQRLRTALELLTRKVEIETTMRVTGDNAGALLLLRQAIPCILHCENRCGEKFLKMFLLEIFNHFAGETKLQDEFLKEFEDYVNLNVLGKPWSKGNWRLSTTQNSNKEKTIADQGMPNTHVRRFMDAFDQLADIFLWYDEERKEQWKKSMDHWRKLMDMAGQREDFSDEEIDEFGTQCDDFFESWVDLTGLEGMTNYIHMIGSGHMTYYLREWRNLYRYSQQGWEALNSLLKNIYFRRTQRGGHKGDGKTRNSKLAPIAKWMQRRLYFLSGRYKEI
jgi:hypothetical protein